MRALVLAAALCLAACAAGSAATAPISSPALDDLARTGVNSSLVIYRNGKVVRSEAFGLASADEAHFPIYSLSKPMTAAAAARLVESGRVDPSSDIRTYLPDFPERDIPINVLQLAQHRSGIRHYLGDEATAECNDIDESLDRFRDDPLVAAPGAETTYSSHGFVALSAVIARAFEAPFDQAMENLLFEPLGMEPKLADSPTPGAPGLTCKFGAGGFLASAPDVARFALGMFKDGFLSPRSQQLFLRGKDSFSASGVGPGGSAFMWVRPGRGEVIVLLSDGDSEAEKQRLQAVFDGLVMSLDY